MADTTSSGSLSDIIQAAQAASAAPVETTATADPIASETTASDSQTQTTAQGDSATNTSADDIQATDSGGEGEAAIDTTAAAPASIDWGSAMPALAAKAQQLLGEDAGVLTKYSDIDSLIRSIAEREKQVGQQSTYVGAFNQLAAAGVSVQDLQALMASKRAGSQQQQPAATNGQQVNPAWSKAFLAGRDAEGKPIFNKSELNRHGLTEAQAAQAFAAWQDQLADIFSGPEGVQQLIASVVDPRLGYIQQQTKQELTAAQQAQQAEQYAQQEKIAEESAASAWANSNANLLYVNKKDPNGGVTKFYQEMEAYMKKLNPAMPWAQQLEESKNAVLAMSRPAQAAATTPSDKAKRLPATSTTAAKLTPGEFHKKYGDRYDGLGLAEWVNYEASGKLPEPVRSR